MEILTCSSGELPASRIQLLACEKESKTPEATSRLSLLNWLIAQAPAGFVGKMCRASCRAGKDKILPASYRFCADGKSQPQSHDGANQESSRQLQDVSGWHGELWTLNIPEWNLFPTPCHNADAVCSLSDILESGSIPHKYYLTAKCALGILRRAAKRGKDLPKILKAALIRQSQSECAVIPEMEEKAHL
jgi:hypothetical protein